MQATRTLPVEYTAQGSMNLKENRGLLILLNVLGVPWFILCAAFFIFMASLMGALGSGNGSGSVTLASATLLLYLVVVVVTSAVVLILHELLHGLFFWLFTRSHPRFGFKGLYAYAAAPGWYIPRPQFLVVGLAPLVLISLIGLLALKVLPQPFALLALIASIVNATGAIGDLYTAARLLFAPSHVLIEDEGESIRWFAPAA